MSKILSKSHIFYVVKNPGYLLSRLLDFLLNKWRFQDYHFTDIVKRPSVHLTPGCISLGRKVYIGKHARIEGVTCYQGDSFTPRIVIGEGVSIQQNVHLTCACRVEIMRNTAIAANVTITDVNHPYQDITLPVESQRLEVKEVVIGRDSKVYNGVVILPGVHIGNHCVIGANSVVTHDIPDFCVAVGAPAKIIKKYNFKQSVWESVR